jgi:hypothetical protein
VNALTELRHEVEQRIEFYIKFLRPRGTSGLELSLFSGSSVMVTASTPLPSGAS